MPVENGMKAEGDKTFIEPIRWRRNWVAAGYIIVGLIVQAQIIRFFAARSILAWQ